MSDFDAILVLAVLAIIAFVPMLLDLWVFGGRQMTSFQVYDGDCPDKFTEWLKKKLGKVFKER